MRIHGEGWSEVLVDINHDGIMTHLGVIWNMDLNNDKQFEAIKETLGLLGSRILRHSGRVGDKLLALEYCLRSNIVYRMQFCIWGYDRYMELDNIYTKIVRKICRNMDSYPSIPPSIRGVVAEALQIINGPPPTFGLKTNRRSEPSPNLSSIALDDDKQTHEGDHTDEQMES